MRALSLALVALLSFAGLAAAQVPPDDPAAAEARAHFDRGRELAESRRFSEAVQAFERSLALVDRPSTVLNLAICLFALERYVEAIEALERYEVGADPAVEGDGIADARRMLGHARANVARLVVEVAPAEAAVLLDGAPIEGGAARERAVNPGPHVVRVEAPHHAPALLEVEIAPGETIRRAVTLESTRRPARLEVRASRPDARIAIDGRDVGAGEAALELPAGPHEVEVRASDGDPVARRVELDWNERLRVDLQLPGAAPPLHESPEFWGILGGTVAAVAAGVLIAVLVVELGDDPAPNGGTTGEVLRPGAPGGGVILP